MFSGALPSKPIGGDGRRRLSPKVLGRAVIFIRLSVCGGEDSRSFRRSDADSPGQLGGAIRGESEQQLANAAALPRGGGG